MLVRHLSCAKIADNLINAQINIISRVCMVVLKHKVFLLSV